MTVPRCKFVRDFRLEIGCGARWGVVTFFLFRGRGSGVVRRPPPLAWLTCMQLEHLCSPSLGLTRREPKAARGDHYLAPPRNKQIQILRLRHSELHMKPRCRAGGRKKQRRLNQGASSRRGAHSDRTRSDGHEDARTQEVVVVGDGGCCEEKDVDVSLDRSRWLSLCAPPNFKPSP